MMSCIQQMEPCAPELVKLGHVRLVNHAVAEDTLCLMHPQAGNLCVIWGKNIKDKFIVSYGDENLFRKLPVCCVGTRMLSGKLSV